ncbi:MAG: WYL domain-containing protein [Paludibacteraceae bacterium]|nr:WYL domain-containing protein [Paludibacteraceae bacterium]
MKEIKKEEAPIEVYEHKYYRYADADYSITDMPLSQNDYEVMQEAVDMLRQLEDFEQFNEMSDIVSRLQDKLAISKHNRKPIIHFDSVPNLKGLQLLNPLYNYISHKQTIKVMYQSFSAKSPQEFILFPYLLKEFRNRWFLYGSRVKDLVLYNLPLDRIVSIEAIDIPYEENKRFDVEHFFDDVIGVSKNINNTPRKIKFGADAEQSNYIKTKPIHRSQKLISENQEDGSCIFKIEVVVNYEMYSVFMSYGPGIKIISPKFVAKNLEGKFKKAYQQYKNELQENENYKED